MLYSRKTFDRHNIAIDAADSCISAAIAHSDYGARVEPFRSDFEEICELFRNPGEAFEVARLFVKMTESTPFSGIYSLEASRLLDQCRKRTKGALMSTRMIMADKDEDPDAAKEHLAVVKRNSEIEQLKDALKGYKI